MHFEVLVEDQSGKNALEQILPKILGANYGSHSWRLRSYKGLGRLPEDLRGKPDPRKRILLERLPRILQGYGRSLPDSATVVVVVDLDNRDCKEFKQELLDVLAACYPRPRTLFRIAIEESEAWLLGDRTAIKAAYPKASESTLNRYVQDSICNTWELLADAIHPGGSARLKREGYPVTGEAKGEWARNIAPRIDVEKNRSKSFQVFRDGIRQLAGIE